MVRPVSKPAAEYCATGTRAGPLVFDPDETIERRSGPRIAAKGVYQDAVHSSHSHFVKAMGLRWLSLMWLIDIPWALPFLTILALSARYHAQREGHHHKTLTHWARQMLACLHHWLPNRELVVVWCLRRWQWKSPSRPCASRWVRRPSASDRPPPSSAPHQSYRTSRGRPRPAAGPTPDTAPGRLASQDPVHLRRCPGPRARHPLDRRPPLSPIPASPTDKNPRRWTRPGSRSSSADVMRGTTRRQVVTGPLNVHADHWPHRRGVRGMTWRKPSDVAGHGVSLSTDTVETFCRRVVKRRKAEVVRLRVARAV